MAQNLAMVQAEMETITNMFNRCVPFPTLNVAFTGHGQ